MENLTIQNATDINSVWFHFFNIYTGERKSSHFDDFAHLRYKNVKLLHTIDDLSQSRATFIRANDRSVEMLTRALGALRKNKTHITDEYIELVIDDLIAARNTLK